MTIQDDQTITTDIATQIAEVAPPPDIAPAADPAPKQSMRDQIESETKKLMDRPRDEADHEQEPAENHESSVHGRPPRVRHRDR